MICKCRNEYATDLSHVLPQDSPEYEDLCLCLYHGSHGCHDCKYIRNSEEYVRVLSSYSKILIICVLYRICTG